MYNYIQKKQNEANYQIFDFMNHLDMDQGPNNVKLQYYYFINKNK